MANTKTLLEADQYFHIFNHAVGEENLFNHEANYIFFLQKLKEYLQYYVDFYAYCLMPNHFHLIVRIKGSERIFAELRKKSRFVESKAKEQDFIAKSVSQRFSNLYNSYAQAYNKENNRKGSLFNNRFKREPIVNEEYLRKVIVYVHNNPVTAGISPTPDSWPFSSFNSICSKSPSLIKRKEVIELFEDLNNFKFCHSAE